MSDSYHRSHRHELHHPPLWRRGWFFAKEASPFTSLEETLHEGLASGNMGVVHSWTKCSRTIQAAWQRKQHKQMHTAQNMIQTYRGKHTILIQTQDKSHCGVWPRGFYQAPHVRVTNLNLKSWKKDTTLILQDASSQTNNFCKIMSNSVSSTLKNLKMSKNSRRIRPLINVHASSFLPLSWMSFQLSMCLWTAGQCMWSASHCMHWIALPDRLLIAFTSFTSVLFSEAKSHPAS